MMAPQRRCQLCHQEECSNVDGCGMYFVIVYMEIFTSIFKIHSYILQKSMDPAILKILIFSPR